MSANDYEFVAGLDCVYLARKIKSKKFMSKDRRVVTENEILGLFEFYLRRCVEECGCRKVAVKRHGEPIFEAKLLDEEEEEKEVENARN